MRKVWMATAAAAMALAASEAASAGTYIPVPMVPGAVSEIVFGINDSNVVAGSFRDSANVEHGFFGPLDGSNWTTFDFPGEGTTGTEPRYISDKGAIDGFATNPSFQVGEEFYRAPDGTFSVFEKDGQPLDGVAQGMNKKGLNLGDYLISDGRHIGYRGKKGEYQKDFRLHLNDSKHFPEIGPRGITDLGVVTVGLFIDAAAIQHAFSQDNRGKHNKLVLMIDYPNATGTALEGVNNLLLASGQWIDSASNTHAFTIDISDIEEMKIKDLDPGDGSTSQQAWGINDDGLVTISTSIGRSYIYCPQKTPDKCPKGGFATNEEVKPFTAYGGRRTKGVGLLPISLFGAKQ